MKTTQIISSMIIPLLVMLSCSNDPNTVKVPAGNFSYTPLPHWQLAFDEHEHEEEYKIYSASYEVKSKTSDKTIAIVLIHAQHLDPKGFGCRSFERYDRFPLQKIVQKKYGLKEPDLCTLIGTNKLIFCDSQTRVDFEFQQEGVFVQCFLQIADITHPELYDEAQLIDDFDTFARSFTAL